MPNLAPAAATPLELAGSNLVLVYAVLAIAVIALVFGLFFRRQVLAADPGTENMQTIGAAVEEGAQAYLNRQFRTLGIFVVLVFGLLFLLPADTFSLKLGRSLFFVVGAVFSALIGYLGMSLAVKANVRVASAARDGNRDLGMRIAFRTGGTVGMATVGSACSARRSSCWSTRATPRRSSRASASAPRCSRCSCESAAASSPRPPTSAPTSSARSRRASPRTTRATRPPSPTTSATTSATAPAWPRTSSSRMRSRWSPR